MLNLEIGKHRPMVVLFPEYSDQSTKPTTDRRTHTIGVIMVDHESTDERVQIALTLPPDIRIYRYDKWPAVMAEYPNAVYQQTGKRVRDLLPTDDPFQLPILTQKKSYAHRQKSYTQIRPQVGDEKHRRS
jgi:hypothetical protein